MKKFYIFLLPLLVAGNLFAQTISPEIQALAEYLDNKTLSKLIPAKNAEKVYRLAQEEELEINDSMVITDQTLVLLNPKAVTNTKFSDLVDDLQQKCYAAYPEKRMRLLSQWREVWLEEVGAYLRYAHSLKPIWKLDLYQSFDYTDNANLVDPDKDVFSEEASSGVTFDGNLRLRPWINQDTKGWDFITTLNAFTKIYNNSDLKDAGYEAQSVGLGQTATHKLKKGFVNKYTLSYNFTKSYRPKPERYSDYDQHRVGLSVGFQPFIFKNTYFRTYTPSINISYRKKTDAKDPSVSAFDPANNVFSEAGRENESDTLSISLMETLATASSVKVPFQLSFNLYYDSHDNTAHSYSYSRIGLGAFAIVLYPEAFGGRGLSWTSSLDYSSKDWDTEWVNASETTDKNDEEGTLSIASGVSTRWNAFWSSALSLSYSTRDRTVVSGVDRVSSTDKSIDQFNIILSNIVLTR